MPMPMGGMPSEQDIFGGGAPAAGGAPEVGDAELDAMFAEGAEEMGEEDKLMDSLIGAGFSPTPEQLAQIMEILQGGGMAPEGVEPTETGMETAPPVV